MPWEIDTTVTYDLWFETLTDAERISVYQVVALLGGAGPTLGFPYSSKIHGSRHGRLRELRIQHRGRAIRVLYAFDPRRVAVLLLGGDKTGDDRWYERHVPIADDLFNDHVRELEDEGLI